MKKNSILFMVVILFLSGCQALNYKTSPSVLENCNYVALPGIEFALDNSADTNLLSHYQHIYVANSRVSATLNYSLYHGMNGKLTDEVLLRYYPEPMIKSWHSPFRDDWDDFYSDFYLTPKQRVDKFRRENFVVRKAILQNCEIIYIKIDSLAENQLSLDLLPKNEITLLPTAE